jgi:hypothetical protein
MIRPRGGRNTISLTKADAGPPTMIRPGQARDRRDRVEIDVIRQGFA